MSRNRVVALGLLAASCIGAAVLLLVETNSGAGDFGRRTFEPPCTAAPDPYPEKGVDAALQRIALSALNGAACDLGTSREELVLSFAEGSGFEAVEWDRPTLERALRSGLHRAIDDAVERGSLPSVAARPLRFAVDKAPINWILGRLGVRAG